MLDRLSCRDPEECKKLEARDPKYHQFLVDQDRALRERLIANGAVEANVGEEAFHVRRVKELDLGPALRMTDYDRSWAAVHLAQYYQNPAAFEEQPFQSEPPPDYVL